MSARDAEFRHLCAVPFRESDGAVRPELLLAGNSRPVGSLGCLVSLGRFGKIVLTLFPSRGFRQPMYTPAPYLKNRLVQADDLISGSQPFRLLILA